MTIAIRIGKWVATFLLTLVLLVYFAAAFNSRTKPDLSPEFQIFFEHEFDASQEETIDWSAYLAIEDRLADELTEKVPAASRPDSLVDRYSKNSLTSPHRFDSNWNRSYEMSAVSPRGVAVLIHGLTDSPYTMLSTAEALVDAGYSVVAPRMPGHGFAVGGLLQTRWEDWAAAVRMAVRHAMQQAGADQTLLLVGYSKGGLMAVDYALRCEEYEDLACPDALVLMSPAIAVSPLAIVTNLHSAVSWMPHFEKFRWQSVLPEVDPFKFTSFPNRAAWEMYRILERTHGELAQAEEIAKLPPILTFQSAVDNTVSARAIVSLLYDRLPENGSSLVVYDVNSNSTLLALMKGDAVGPAAYFKSMAPLNFNVTVIQNRDSVSRAVDTMTLLSGSSDADIAATNMEWPESVFSLSHIALPFRADDAVYGDGNDDVQGGHRVSFGALAPRGERSVMRLNAEYFLRMRYNPFFAFQQSYMIEWLEQLQQSKATP